MREQERIGWSGGHLSLLEKSEEAAPALREAADLAHCEDGSVGPIDLLPQPGLKRSRFFFSDTEQDVLWRARCLRVSVCRCKRGSQVSWVNLKPTCKPTPGHQHASTNIRVNAYACVCTAVGDKVSALYAMCTIGTPAHSPTHRRK